MCRIPKEIILALEEQIEHVQIAMNCVTEIRKESCFFWKDFLFPRLSQKLGLPTLDKCLDDMERMFHSLIDGYNRSIKIEREHMDPGDFD